MFEYKSFLDFLKAMSINILALIIRYVPRFLSDWLCSFFGFLAFVLLKGRRRGILETLMVIKPESTKYSLIKCGFKTLANYSRNFADFLRLRYMSAQELVNLVELDGVERISGFLKPDRGVIAITAHIGNWEVGSNFLAAFGFPIVGVAESAGPGETFYKLFKRYREHFGMKVVSLEHPSVVFKLRKFLKKGYLVGLIGDRDISGTGIEVEFFGRKAVFPQGPAFLSLVTGCPIMPAFFVRNHKESRKKYISQVENIIEFKKGKNRREDIRELTQLIAQTIERKVKSYPDQWFSFPPPWKF